MKKYFSSVIFFLFAFNIGANSQTIDLPLDSLTKILCNNKWELDYALMGEMKIYRTPDATNMILDFKKDKTLTMNDGKSKKQESGNWIYDAKKKQIKLNIGGQSLLVIVSISPNQFTTVIDPIEAKKTDKGNPDLTDIKTVFKIKAD